MNVIEIIKIFEQIFKVMLYLCLLYTIQDALLEMKQTELGRQNLFDKIHRCRQLREQNHVRQQYDQRVSLQMCKLYQLHFQLFECMLLGVLDVVILHF
jgi:hypothetical protein